MSVADHICGSLAANPISNICSEARWGRRYERRPGSKMNQMRNCIIDSGFDERELDYNQGISLFWQWSFTG
jgi:hypothetical protein